MPNLIPKKTLLKDLGSPTTRPDVTKKKGIVPIQTDVTRAETSSPQKPNYNLRAARANSLSPKKIFDDTLT